ncbi:MAG: fasciclin domain-containing protein [Propionibacteriaceae bacterium]
MIMNTQRTRIAALTAALILPLGLAACGGGDESAGGSSEPETAPSSAPASSPAESPGAEAPFGAACADVPTEGEGSVDGMADDPVATAASNNPLLTTLVSAVGEAGLVDTLNSEEALTVFAPTDEAFEKVPAETMDAAMGDPDGLLTDVLTAHVVAGRVAPADLAGEHDTLNADQPVTIEGSGEDFTVNGTAMVVCGNVQTANATVYLVDEVLLPAS